MMSTTAPTGQRFEIVECPWCKRPWQRHDDQQRRACAAQPFTEGP